MNGQKTWRITARAIAALVLAGSALQASVAATADDWQVDGEHGELQAHGLLLEGACRLDMTSVFQQVDLGEISRSQLLKPGDEGPPVHVHLKLRDCSRSGGDQTDRYTGTRSQDTIQPVVTLSFIGVTDFDMPALLKTTGVSGLALKLTDPQGRRVQPGQRGEPMFVTPGDNDLVYTVTPVRTPAALTSGEFRAVTNVEISYD